MKELGVTSRCLYRKEENWNDTHEVASLFHLNYLNRVLFCLEEGNLLVSTSKMQVLCQERPHTYLGYCFEKDVISLPLKTIQTIKELPAPKTLTEVQRLIGYTVYFSCILRHSRSYVSFLSNKTRKGVKFEWTEDDEIKFERLKSILSKIHLRGFALAMDSSVKNKRY